MKLEFMDLLTIQSSLELANRFATEQMKSGNEAVIDSALNIIQRNNEVIRKVTAILEQEG